MHSCLAGDMADYKWYPMEGYMAAENLQFEINDNGWLSATSSVFQATKRGNIELL